MIFPESEMLLFSPAKDFSGGPLAISPFTEKILGNIESRKAVLTKQPQREAILRGVAASVLDSPLEELPTFIEDLFQVMAFEGDLEATNRRDYALEILQNEEMMQLLEPHSPTVINAYIAAVNSQTKKNDALTGSIHTLLEAGKTVALLVHGARTRTRITQTWVRVADKFRRRDPPAYIRNQLTVIQERMSDQWQFDRKVARLLDQDKTPEEIAKELKVRTAAVLFSIRRLYERNEIDES